MDNERTPQPSKGEDALGTRIEVAGQGMGVPSDDLVAERAREIAEIENRPGQVTAADYHRAARELGSEGARAGEGPTAPEIGAEDAPDARDPAQVHGSGAVHRQDIDPTDEQTAPDRLVREGVAEADHEQMLEARREAGQENETTADDDPARETGGAE